MLFDQKRLAPVTEIIRSEAWSTQYNALRITTERFGFIGQTLRNRRTKMLYRSIVIARCAERLEQTDSRDEACRILQHVIAMLAPPWGLYLGLVSSYAGFVIVLLSLANQKRETVRDLYSEFCAA